MNGCNRLSATADPEYNKQYENVASEATGCHEHEAGLVALVRVDVAHLLLRAVVELTPHGCHEPSRVDELIYVSQADAEDMARRLAREEGLFCGISAAGACWAALQLAQTLNNATIVFIVCDRGDRYLSTGVFPA